MSKEDIDKMSLGKEKLLTRDDAKSKSTSGKISESDAIKRKLSNRKNFQNANKEGVAGRIYNSISDVYKVLFQSR